VSTQPSPTAIGTDRHRSAVPVGLPVLLLDAGRSSPHSRKRRRHQRTGAGGCPVLRRLAMDRVGQPADRQGPQRRDAAVGGDARWRSASSIRHYGWRCYRSMRPLPRGWSVLVPALLPPLVALYAMWARLPTSRGASSRRHQRCCMGAIIVLTTAPFPLSTVDRLQAPARRVTKRTN
jgi:hypothetical protein